MKSIILLMILLPFTLAVTNKQCKSACRSDHGNVGGRVATNNNKGPYGFNDDVDCTCVFPWQQ